MLYISEWMPNPDGTDRGAEWIELGNSGSAPVSLAGWSVSNGTAKRIMLPSDSVPANGVLLLPQSVFRFTVRNKDESISLFDPSGNLATESHFFGVAPSGKSVNFGEGGTFFAVPTPGAANAETGAALIASQYPQSGIISSSLSASGFFGLILGTALILALCVTIAIIHHDDLRELFFPKHQEIR